MSSGKRFRVALSFPGSKREYVEAIANGLAKRFGDEQVLYDRFHTAEFAVSNLAFKLPALYANDSDLIVVVLCGDYATSEWCGLEWSAIYSIIKKRRPEDVMLFRADDAEIPGLYGLEGDVPVGAFRSEDAVTLILQRLARNEGKPRDFYLPNKKAADRSDDYEAAVTRLPRKHDDGVFEGREKEIANLDRLWADVLSDTPRRARIVSLVAIGGAGKTTIASRWKDDVLRRDGHGGVERYFDWSFYSQGTRVEGDNASAQTASDSTVFIAEALKWFGDEEMADSPAAAWDKGARLASLVAEHRTLLILDGLEPLQHPPGPQKGELKDDAIRALFAGLQNDARGLCVVTTRESIADLAPGRTSITPEWLLDHLTDAAGARVLSGHGVTGPDEELRLASREVKGHALTLSLMGRYLKLAFDPPDIARRDCFHFSEADAETQNGHAFRVFAAYEAWFESEGRHVELAILRLLGLFDRPATPDCLGALCEPPAIEGLTEPLVRISEQKWNAAIQRLRELDLVETVEYRRVTVTGFGEKEARAEMAAAREGGATKLGRPQTFDNPQVQLRGKHLVDAHPVLREYFDARLKSGQSGLAAHERLHRHLCSMVPYWPEGREGLLPLYQSVAHGCRAGLYQQAYHVYYARICRGATGPHAFYSSRRLGLLGLNLGAVANFFSEPWDRLFRAFSAADESWLLNEAAFYLYLLNRLTEGLKPMRTALETDMRERSWQNAARQAINLSELELSLGDVKSSESTAVQAVMLADRGGDPVEQMITRSTHAASLLDAGRIVDSLELFADAEARQAQLQPTLPLLYSLRGWQYINALLASHERVAWRCFLGDVDRNLVNLSFEGIEQRAKRILDWQTAGGSLYDGALDHFSLGRVYLLRAILQEVADDRRSAQYLLDVALGIARRASAVDRLPHLLLTQAWLLVISNELIAARLRLDEAFAIATRGGTAQNDWQGALRLRLVDTLLHRARLFGRTKPYPWPERTPQIDLDEAAALIEACGYHRRDQELADAREALG